MNEKHSSNWLKKPVLNFNQSSPLWSSTSLEELIITNQCNYFIVVESLMFFNSLKDANIDITDLLWENLPKIAYSSSSLVLLWFWSGKNLKYNLITVNCWIESDKNIMRTNKVS